MGILNLLQVLGPATVDAHLSEFRGHTLGVDAMCWLHRAAFSCPMELARSETDPSAVPHPLAYLKWIRRMLVMARDLGVKLLVVFDGANLPAKQGTNSARDAMRSSHRARADALYEAGDREGAAALYGRCISVTSTMRRNAQHLLTCEGVPFIVAPFEADAQLGFLYRTGAIHAAITSDSDLLAFGCQKILIKLDREGNGRLIDLEAVQRGKWDQNSKEHKVLYQMQRILRAGLGAAAAASAAFTAAAASSSIAASSSAAAAAASSSSSSSAAAAPASPSSSVPLCSGHDRFLWACVLSGCDYLPSLRGIGLRKALALVDEFGLVENVLYNLKDQRNKIEAKAKKDKQKLDRLERLEREAKKIAARTEEDLLIDDEEEEEEAAAAEAASAAASLSTPAYIARFFEALLTFQHQLVYDPATKRMTHLTPMHPQLHQRWEQSMSEPRLATTTPETATEEKRAAGASPDNAVQIIDDDNEIDLTSSSSRDAQEAAELEALRTAAASFPSFRDVTNATAAFEAALRNLEQQASSSSAAAPAPLPLPPLAPSHPLLLVRNFRFLGSPLDLLPRSDALSLHLAESVVADWVAGRIDPKTRRRHRTKPGFNITDLHNATEGNNNGNNNGNGAWKRNASTSAVPAAAAAAASSAKKANFFGRSSSAAPSSSSAALQPSSRNKLPFAFTAGSRSSGAAAAAPSTAPFRASLALSSARRQDDLGELDGLFGSSSNNRASSASAKAAEEEQKVEAPHEEETQRLDEEDEDMLFASSNAADDAGGDAARGLSGAFTPPPPTASNPSAAAAGGVGTATSYPPVSQLNPFARQLRTVEPVATFADFISTSSSPSKPHRVSAAAPSSTPAKPSGSLLAQMFSSPSPSTLGGNRVGSAAAAASSSSSSASKPPPPRSFFVIKQAASTMQPAPTRAAPAAAAAPVAAAAGGSPAASRSSSTPLINDVYDLTREDATAVEATPSSSSSFASPSLKRKSSTPTPNLSAAASRRSSSPLKRKKSAPASAAPAAGSVAISHFFRKSS